MNRYEIKISGAPLPIQVKATSAAVALRRALNRFTDSQFLNTTITVKLVGRHVEKQQVFHVKAITIDRGFHRLGTMAYNLPSREVAREEMKRLREQYPQLTRWHITSSLIDCIRDQNP